jgi:hypothetical protein
MINVDLFSTRVHMQVSPPPYATELCARCVGYCTLYRSHSLTQSSRFRRARKLAAVTQLHHREMSFHLYKSPRGLLIAFCLHKMPICEKLLSLLIATVCAEIIKSSARTLCSGKLLQTNSLSMSFDVCVIDTHLC